MNRKSNALRTHTKMVERALAKLHVVLQKEQFLPGGVREVERMQQQIRGLYRGVYLYETGRCAP